MRKLYSYGVLVVRGEPIRSFLLMVHKDRLDLPKGHIDKGENEVECALRELREETGILPADIELITDFRFSTSYSVWPDKYNGEECQKTTTIFLGRLLRDMEIKVTEHVAYQWHDWSPPHHIQAETIDPLLAHLERYLASTAK